MKTGEMQTLVAKRATANGIYLADQEGIEVLLPKGEVPVTMNIGDIVEVFLYRDSQDRLIATLKKPYIQKGELKKLKVKQITNIGAFLDWGLTKDLFLPFKEQTGMINKNSEYLVALYVDKSDRLCATMKIYKYLSDDVKYKLGSYVDATVYNIDEDKGVFVALEDKYFGFIPKQEVVRDIEVGDSVKVRITMKREDKKYNVSLRKPIPQKIDDDADYILRLMREWEGELLVTEKDSPEKIKRLCNMSKAEFKRAIGKLLKAEKIYKDGDKIKRLRR